MPSAGDREPLMSTASHDPFHVVKEELVAKLEALDGRVQRFTALLHGPTSTAGNPAFREAKKAAARDARAAEAQVKDLGLTVEYVERSRASFAHIVLCIWPHLWRTWPRPRRTWPRPWFTRRRP